jgi:hypothetical protein
VHLNRDRRRIEPGQRAAVQDGNRHNQTAQLDPEEGGAGPSALFGAWLRFACFQLGDPRLQHLELFPRAQ